MVDDFLLAVEDKPSCLSTRVQDTSFPDMDIDDDIERWFDILEALTPTGYWARRLVPTSLRIFSSGGPFGLLLVSGNFLLQGYNNPKAFNRWNLFEGVMVTQLWFATSAFVWYSLNWCWPWIPYCNATSGFIAKRWWLRYLWNWQKDTLLSPWLWDIAIPLLRFGYERLYLGLLLVLAFIWPLWDLSFKFVVSSCRTRLESIGFGKHTEYINCGSVLDSYVYRPLTGPRDIRLLHWPRRTIIGRDGEPRLVRCAIGEESYDCISYVWGTESKDSHIIVDRQRLAVTNTVPDILNSLRSTLQDRKLWIDAVCINQAEGASVNLEKTHQVRMVADIYSNARKVIVWLGQEELIVGIEASALLRELRWIAKNYHRRPHYAARQRLANHFYHRRWQALSALLRRPWFERVWTIQEAVMASKIEIYYAGLFIPWQALVDTSNFLDLLPPGQSLYTLLLVSEGKDWIDTRWWCSLRSLPEGFRRVAFVTMLREMRRNEEEPFDFRHMLSLMHRAKAKHARDMLYAVQGLIPNQKSGSLLPDYHNSDEEVFMRAARYLLSLDDPLDMLAYAGLNKRRSSTLPSWVPDLGHLPESPTLMMSFDSGMRYFASANSSHKAQLAPDFRTLTVSGTIVDKVYRLGSTIDALQPEEGIDMSAYCLRLADTLNEARALFQHPNHIGRSSADDAIWRTMTADRDLVTQLQPLPREYIDEGLAWELHWK